MSNSPRIGFISLGCPKNLVDSERILTQMRAEGYIVTNSYADADLVVVNTCGFIDAAVEESLTVIGEAMNENGRVIVTGCLGARDELVLKAHPEVLAISGAHAYEEVMSAVHDQLPPPHHPYHDSVPPQGIKLTPRHYAYLKIAEGCNHSCSFCIIPQFRGPLVSRPIDEVMLEAENLVNSGVRELLVVAQDTSAYGVDVNCRPGFWQGRPVQNRLLDLASVLGELGVWVRLHYIYPYPSVDKLIPLMADGKILPYLDIPLQHGSERVLRAMQRPAASEKVLDRIATWRDICPDITLRSTFIIGFPGETEDEFEELLQFISEAQLDRVGAFAYSPVDGASANALPNQIAEEVKQERLERFMLLQEEISRKRLQQKVGQEQIVLVDEVHAERIIARSAADAPEIDGNVIIQGGWDIDPGDFIQVRMTDSSEHDLFAVPTDFEEE
jgi:ribosomal protein S12 methylthiotransferase